MSRSCLTVLGGSTPFTVALFDALVAAGEHAPPPADVTLHGRNVAALDAVARYGRHVLADSGWTVQGTTDVDDALDGADVVVHQIRYGDLRGRQADEVLAGALGVPGDETLGPGGLAAAVRLVPGLRSTTAALARRCGDALIVNLTNPLSVTTALLHQGGLSVVGVCELPLQTLRQACAHLGVDPAEVEWAYAGLNHRGFLHRLHHRGHDLLPELAAGLGEATIGGITGADVAALGALPLKYFSLFTAGVAPTPGRAVFLEDVRRRALAELRERPERSPPSLAARRQPWYGEAVVPLLAAMAAAEPSDHVLDLPSDDGLVREVRVLVSERGIAPVPASAPTPEVARWVERFEHHERLVLAAARDPRADRLRAALAADPLLPPERVDTAVALLTKAPGDHAAAPGPTTSR